MSNEFGNSGPHGFCMHMFISFVDYCIKNEKFKELERLGLSTDIIAEYEDMSVAARTNLSNSQARCFDFMIYSDVLREMIDEAKSDAFTRKTITDCIVRGAPYPMMKRLYDLPHRRFKSIRRIHGMRSEGALVTDDPDLIEAIEDAWVARGRGFDPTTMLSVSDATGASLRVIWSVLEQHLPRRMSSGARAVPRGASIEGGGTLNG